MNEQPPQQLKLLTALRFFAAMWVVLFHYWPKLLGAGAMPNLVAKGYLGVELFFVLSGFILCHVYLPATERGEYRHGGFIWARIARVYPLHLACILGVGGLIGGAYALHKSIDPNIADLASLPANLLMVHAWGFAPKAAWNHPSWSISAEWFAYLTFPAFAWVAIRLRARPRLAMTAAALALAGAYVLFDALAGFPLTRATTSWGFVRIVPCFLFGCTLYLAWRAGAVEGRSKGLIGAAVSGVGLVASAALGAPDALIVVLAGLLILFLASLSKLNPSGRLIDALEYLGEVSYSIYMICIPWELLFVNIYAIVLKPAVKELPVSIWLGFFLAVVPLAALSHALIEKPARTRLKSWTRPRWLRRTVAHPA